jgi:putative MATE family efflux protein
MMKVKELFKRNKLVLKLALPIFFELIFTILIGSVDQYMISSDQTAVNAIIQVNTICNVVVIAFNVLATASMILISQYHGAKDSKEANLIYALSFYINLIIGLVISAFLFFGSDLIFSMMGIDSSVIPDADIYMKYTGAFIFLQGMTTTFSAFLRANKLMVQSTVISLCANIINIAGNAILLYVIPMGIEGIAIASTVSRIIALILVMVVYFRKIGVSLSIRKLFPFNHRLVHNLLKIGLPSAGENFSYNFSQVAILIILNMDGVMAGNIKGYASNIVMLVYIFASGITTAMQVIEGEYLGSGKIKEADQLVKDTTKMSIIVSFCISIILFAISYPLFYLLMQSSSDPQICCYDRDDCFGHRYCLGNRKSRKYCAGTRASNKRGYKLPCHLGYYILLGCSCRRNLLIWTRAWIRRYRMLDCDDAG